MHYRNQQHSHEELTPEGLNIYRKKNRRNIRLQRSRTNALITFYKYKIPPGFTSGTSKSFLN